MPHLKAVNTSNKEDVMNDLKLRMDISVYNHVKSVSPPARTYFSQTELWMEFKTSGVAFKDPVMFGPGSVTEQMNPYPFPPHVTLHTTPDKSPRRNSMISC